MAKTYAKPIRAITVICKTTKPLDSRWLEYQPPILRQINEVSSLFANLRLPYEIKDIYRAPDSMTVSGEIEG